MILSSTLVVDAQERFCNEVMRTYETGFREASSIFLEGCAVPQVFASASERDRFTFVDVGFGVGVNFLATWSLWRKIRSTSKSRNVSNHLQRLNYVGIESNPLCISDLRCALASLSGTGCDLVEVEHFCQNWPLPIAGLHLIEFPSDGVQLTLGFGSLRQLLSNLSCTADFFYLSELTGLQMQECSVELAETLVGLARPGAKIASRFCGEASLNALNRVGFQVERKKGRIEGVYLDTPSKSFEDTAISGCYSALYPFPGYRIGWASPRVMVLGAGLAGIAVSSGFMRQGWSVYLLEKNHVLGGCGAQQPICLEHCHFSVGDSKLSRLSRHAALLQNSIKNFGSACDVVRHELEEFMEEILEGKTKSWNHANFSNIGNSSFTRSGEGFAQGRLELSRGDIHRKQQLNAISQLDFPAQWVSFVDATDASCLAGITLDQGGLWYPSLSGVDPRAAIADWLFPDKRFGVQNKIHIQLGKEVVTLVYADRQWNALDSEKNVLGQSDVVVLCNSGQVRSFPFCSHFPLQGFFGQTTKAPYEMFSIKKKLNIVMSRYGYITGYQDELFFGSTFSAEEMVPSQQGNQTNAERAARTIGKNSKEISFSGLRTAGFGLRYTTPDRLPCIGPIASRESLATYGLLADTNNSLAADGGLYGVFALGSRGILWSTLASKLLPAFVQGDPVPIEQDLLKAIDPRRFNLRNE